MNQVIESFEKSKDRRSETSAENGKKGGRPRSESTIRAQMARHYIAEQVEASLAPIVAKAIVQAIEGDKDARNWLSERAWGRPAINLGVNDDGDPIEGVEVIVRK